MLQTGRMLASCSKCKYRLTQAASVPWLPEGPRVGTTHIWEGKGIKVCFMKSKHLSNI